MLACDLCDVRSLYVYIDNYSWSVIKVLALKVIKPAKKARRTH
ncbi:hypothetical protein PTD2_19527 [Pseudoalteromonas tunicata D2]|uniref:Uncharacterized protein n=1 Tax=Pseudoalteromonas tunicata D2 TaxID=87626 RepID=A4C9I1_9GAMM|nr:hypothetical protein PTD2_19527 [Pseudoalteromonas tunicata D2]